MHNNYFINSFSIKNNYMQKTKMAPAERKKLQLLIKQTLHDQRATLPKNFNVKNFIQQIKLKQNDYRTI